ncbi:helicase HerA-like domain-containing protein [Streptomyces bauhiniae]
MSDSATTPAPDGSGPAQLPDAARPIAAGYAFTGPALDLGALLWDGVCHPDAQVRVPLPMLNRHGLVAGATGTGKTKTLQLIAEQLSAQGVPVFLADVKGDLSGIARPGQGGERVSTRAAETGQSWSAEGFPVEFLALGGIGHGIPVRATVTSFGPVLLSKVLGLNRTQEQSLGLIFHYADTKGLELVDLKDLRAVVAFLTSDEGKPELKGIGGLSTATAGVILRSLTAFEAQGMADFFGEPEFDTAGLLRLAPDGRGLVSVLELPAVQDKPQLFSTFLMWLLADLFHDLPEVGDADKPKLVFFFDEAHLLFHDASDAFLDAITQTVRLIRSKGVGVFFVTQTPKDVPSDVLGQLDPAELDRAVRESPLYGRYAQAVDRESAYEKLTAAQAQPPAEKPRAKREKAPAEDPSLVEQVIGSGMFKSLARSVGTQLGREITRSLFGTARRGR